MSKFDLAGFRDASKSDWFETKLKPLYLEIKLIMRLLRLRLPLTV